MSEFDNGLQSTNFNKPDLGLNKTLTPEEVATQEEALKSSEKKTTKVLERETLGILTNLEHNEWSSTQEEKTHYELLGNIQALSNRELHLSVPRSVLIDEGAMASGISGWYYGENLNSSYSLSTSVAKVKDVFGDEKFVQTYYLGVENLDPTTGVDTTDSDRKHESEKIGTFLRGVEARQTIGHLSKFIEDHRVSMVDIIEKTHLDLSAELKGRNLEALFSLPCLPEDRVSSKDLESLGSVKFNKDSAASEMMMAALVMMEARNLCEKPDLFKKYVQQKSFSRAIDLEGLKKPAQPTDIDEIDPNTIDLSALLPDLPDQPPALTVQPPPLNPSIFENEVFKEWFGDPSKWEPRIVPSKWSVKEKGVNNLKDQKYFDTKMENNVKNRERGPLAENNLFARKVSVADIKDYKENLVKFLGGSATAVNAVDLAFEFYRVTLCGDFSGFEWREGVEKDLKTGKDIPVLVCDPQMGHLVTDAQQVIRTAECLRFFRHNSRGGLPRGIKESTKPFATDILRGTIYDGDDGKKHSLYSDIFWDGVLPENIPVGKLDDANPLGGSLSLFMAVCRDFGKGSFEIMKEKYPSPEPLLDPAFWEKYWSRLKVGVKAPVVSWSDFWEEGKVSTPSDEEINNYRLEKVRELLDAIFAEAESAKWDTEAKSYGKQNFLTRKRNGIAAQTEGKFDSVRIIDVANEALPGLSYNIIDPKRFLEARTRGGIST